MPGTRRAWVLSIALLATACGGRDSQGPTEPSPLPTPPAGANFSVTPIPVDAIARITPLGYNNEVLPTDHTYWLTCDLEAILPGGRPCRRERLELRAPAAGTVADANTSPDGFVAVEGPPGLLWTFGHVTPRPGINRGTSVAAGQVIATMFYDHGFDFGLTNRGVSHSFVAPERYSEQMLHGQNPIAQYAEPTRSELLARVNSLSDKLGRLSRDVAGTASGAWFQPGAPRSSNAMSPANIHLVIWLGRYIEREDTRIITLGSQWPGMSNRILAVDAGSPSWEDVTPADGAAGFRIMLRPRELPALEVAIFHVALNPTIVKDVWVEAGARIGRHASRSTMSDIATGFGGREGTLVSYFETMTDAVFAQYQARGILSREAAIISRTERDLDPVPCVGEQQFLVQGRTPDWLVLN